MGRVNRTHSVLASALVATVLLSACSGGGADTGNEQLSDDEAGFRDASKVFATLISEQDTEGFCSFLDAENEGTFVRAVGTQDCLAAAESRLSAIPEEERASWASADFSETATRMSDAGPEEDVDPHRFCWARGADVPIGEGSWSGNHPASAFPCMRHNGEKWIVVSDSWLMDF